MSNDECCQNCVEITKCAEKAAEFAENIAKNAKDIAITSEIMAKDAKDVVNICENGRGGFFSSVKGFFGNIKESVPNITGKVLDNSESAFNSVPKAVKVQENVQQVANSQKSISPEIHSPPENKPISPLGTTTFNEPILEELIKSIPEKQSTEKGFMSSKGSILSPKETDLDSIVEVTAMVVNAENIKDIPNKSADSLESLMQTLVKTKAAISDMKDCCSESTEKFNTLVDAAYLEAELLKNDISKTHNDLIPSNKISSENNYNQRISSKVSKLKVIIQEKAKTIRATLHSRETAFFIGGVTIGIGTGYLIGVAARSETMKNVTKRLTNTKE